MSAPSDTEIEVDPPTILDSSSASEVVSNADEVISISDAEDCQPHARGGVEYWQSRCNRFRLIWDELRLDPSFTFELSSESIDRCTNSSRQERYPRAARGGVYSTF